MKNPILFYLLFFIFFFSPFPVPGPSAEESEWEMKFNPESKSLQPTYIAKVLRMTGNVWVKGKNDADWVTVSQGDRFHGEEMLKTDKKAYLKLKMIDQTLIDIGSDSVFHLKKFIYRTQTDRFSLYELVRGKLRSWFRQPAGPDDIKVKAGKVAMGIRGTEILLNEYEERGKTELLVLSGEVELEVTPFLSPGQEWEGGSTYSVKPGTIFESGKFQDVLMKGAPFRTMDAKEMALLRVEKADKEYDLLPFLELLESEGGPAPETPGDDLQERQGKARNSSLLPSPRKETWEDLLQEQQGRRGRGPPPPSRFGVREAAGKGGRDSASCPPVKECMEYSYFFINNKKVALCSKERWVKPFSC